MVSYATTSWVVCHLATVTRATSQQTPASTYYVPGMLVGAGAVTVTVPRWGPCLRGSPSSGHVRGNACFASLRTGICFCFTFILF